MAASKAPSKTPAKPKAKPRPTKPATVRRPARPGPVGVGGSSGGNPSWDPDGSNAAGGSGYTQTFFDDFTGTSLNTNDWTLGWQADSGNTAPINVPSSSANAGVDGEAAGYSSSNVSVSGSILSLELTHSNITIGGITYPYTGSCVTTNPTTLGSGKGFQQALGCFEALVYMPLSGNFIANWPAWWLTGQDWPADGELDILEGLGGTAQFHVNSTDNEPAVGASAPGETDSASNYGSGWHLFGLSWNTDQCDFYYDGVLVGSVATHIPTAPEYLVFDNTTGFASGPEGAATMQIDWVAVWEQPSEPVTLQSFSELTDNFTSTAEIFQQWTGLGLTASSNRCGIECDTSYDGSMQTITQYNLTGSAFYAKILMPTGTVETGMSIGDLAQDQNQSTGESAGPIASIDWNYDGTSLIASLTQNQVATTVATLTYSATTHAWWRIRESGGTLYWDTSADGSAWTNRGSHTYTINVSALYAWIWTGNDGSGSLTTYVSSVNGGTSTGISSVGSMRTGALATHGTATPVTATPVTSAGGIQLNAPGGTGIGGPLTPVTATGTIEAGALGIVAGVQPASQEVFANVPVGVVTAGGTDAPTAGGAETWTVAVATPFAAAAQGADLITFFYGCDPAAPSEKFLVTACPGGTGSQTWTVVRGADGTTPVAHNTGFTVTQVISRASLLALQEVRGTIQLSAGAATVLCSAVTAGSVIFLTSQQDGGTPGWLRVTAVTAGTGFTITSSSATDTSTVGYAISQG